MNFLEKELEDWLFEHPEEFPYEVQWRERQMRLPSGIADLVGYSEEIDSVVLVELKAEGFKSKQLCQVKRYEQDILIGSEYTAEVSSFLVAVGDPGDQMLMEADAMSVDLLSVRSSFSIGRKWGFSKEFVDQRKKQLRDIDFLRDVREAREYQRAVHFARSGEKRKEKRLEEFYAIIQGWYDREASK